METILFLSSVEMKLLHLCCTGCIKVGVVLQVSQLNTLSIVTTNGCDCATNHLLIYDWLKSTVKSESDAVQSISSSFFVYVMQLSGIVIVCVFYVYCRVDFYRIARTYIVVVVYSWNANSCCVLYLFVRSLYIAQLWESLKDLSVCRLQTVHVHS